jgi:hypothetical protein
MLLIAGLLCLLSLALDSLEYLVLGQDVPREVLGYQHDAHIEAFDVGAESSIPAWFSSSVLLLCAVLLAAITSTLNRTGEDYVSHWGGLSIIFALLSLDESVGVHEKFIEPLRSLLGVGGFLYFPWVIPGVAFVVILALIYRRFLFDLPAKSRRLFSAAGALYLSGTLGLEMVGGFWTYHYGEQNLAYRVSVTLEEFLEMAGAVLFLTTLMQYLASLEKSDGQDTLEN